MTLVASLTMPSFSDEERATLRRVEAILGEHPYMRADLGGGDDVVERLEDVLSVRLALLHTEGAASRSTAVLRGQLRAWETELAAAVSAAGHSEAITRYETTRLLHPEPESRDSATMAAELRAAVTARLEKARAQRSAREVLREKLAQNRDFFRHGAMLPFYWARRRRIRKLVPQSVLAHEALRETYFAIEQIGPLVDNFAFRGAGGVPLSSEVALADLAFFYMQLADELLDELAAAMGGHDSAGEVVRSFYTADTSKRPLFDLSVRDLRRFGIDADTHITKFGLSLSELFERLDDLADVLDARLDESNPEIVRATHLFLHHCFQTYLDEAELCEAAPDRHADRLPLQHASWHFYRKNNMVMMLWLDLRARLLDLRPEDHADVIRRWGYLLATFQIFDDLKDLALDLGKQPSYPLQIAACDFPAERAWIEQRFGRRRSPIDRDEVSEVNLRASQTVRQCIEWSRLMALAHFDNALAYAWDQRWRKSWMRRRDSFNPEGRRAPRRTRTHAVDRLIQTLVHVRGAQPTPKLEDAHLAFALDASAYDGAWQIYVALFPNIRAMYRFATLRMWMSKEEKANAARRLLRRYPRARTSALLELAEADVDHEVARDGLETFAKLLEV